VEKEKQVDGRSVEGGQAPAGPDGQAAAAEGAPGLAAEVTRQLVHRLESRLVVVEPRPAFVSELKGRLAVEHLALVAKRATARAKEKEQRLRWAAGLGGALYLASLGFVSFRAAQAVTGRVAALAAARSGQATLPKAGIAT
jgi:hypothetical protein